MESAIPTLVVVVDGGPIMRMLSNLSFAASTDAVPIVYFAHTQHSMFIGLCSYKILSNRAQYFYITVCIAMETLEYLLHLYDESDISAVALDSALCVLNPPTKELTYLLQLCDQEHICGTALGYALRVLASKMLKFLLELHEHDRIGDEALDSALHVLRPPGNDMDEEKTSYKPKQEEEPR